MKFVSKESEESKEIHDIPALGISVGPGEEFDGTEGLAAQCGEGGWLDPVDDEAKAAVEALTAVEVEQPKDSACKAVWETVAEAEKVDVDPTLNKGDYIAAVKAAVETKES